MRIWYMLHKIDASELFVLLSSVTWNSGRCITSIAEKCTFKLKSDYHKFHWIWCVSIQVREIVIIFGACFDYMIILWYFYSLDSNRACARHSMLMKRLILLLLLFTYFGLHAVHTFFKYSNHESKFIRQQIKIQITKLSIEHWTYKSWISGHIYYTWRFFIRIHSTSSTITLTKL